MDWDRLEAEFDDVDVDVGSGSPLAERVLAVVSRRYARRAMVLAVVGMMLAAGLAVAVLLVVLPNRVPAGPGTGFRAAAVLGPDDATRAQIYAAALSGGAGPQRLVRPIWVSSRICRAIPRSPTARPCAGGRIRAGVQRQVIGLLGPRVRFTASPPTPRRPADPPVVQFGKLAVRGTRAELGIESRCGPFCGEGQTLLLREHNGRWQVSGSVGPRWVS